MFYFIQQSKKIDLYRAHREKRLANRKISPPSYAAKESPTNPSLRDDSKSPSRSPSPDHGKITYITSFGGIFKCLRANIHEVFNL